MAQFKCAQCTYFGECPRNVDKFLYFYVLDLPCLVGLFNACANCKALNPYMLPSYQ